MQKEKLKKNKKQIKEAIYNVAKEYNAEVSLGKEDNFTWLSLSKGKINPKIFDEVTRKLSQVTGVDCYFFKCVNSTIEILMSAEINFIFDTRTGAYSIVDEDSVPTKYRKEKLEEYGTLFK